MGLLQAKLKTPGQLQELLDITRELLQVRECAKGNMIELKCD